MASPISTRQFCVSGAETNARASHRAPVPNIFHLGRRLGRGSNVSGWLLPSTYCAGTSGTVCARPLHHMSRCTETNPTTPTILHVPAIYNENIMHYTSPRNEQTNFSTESTIQYMEFGQVLYPRSEPEIYKKKKVNQWTHNMFPHWSGQHRRKVHLVRVEFLLSYTIQYLEQNFHFLKKVKNYLWKLTKSVSTTSKIAIKNTTKWR